MKVRRFESHPEFARLGFFVSSSDAQFFVLHLFFRYFFALDLFWVILIGVSNGIIAESLRKLEAYFYQGDSGFKPLLFGNFCIQNGSSKSATCELNCPACGDFDHW